MRRLLSYEREISEFIASASLKVRIRIKLDPLHIYIYYGKQRKIDEIKILYP